MAQIWLAVQRGPHGFEKTAVLKVILPELCTNDDFVHMFLDEARLAAGLDHNNVVRIYDFGEVDGQYYLAMEHLPGEDLASIMQAQKKSRQMMPLEMACEMIIGAANGLHFAHELTDSTGRLLNVVHRDVSPSNIIVTYYGTVKLVDFGIARAESNINKTAAGTLKGKVAYASPEQAEGLPLDRRSDVFALGTVLYELLTLRKPFKRDSDLATLNAVLHAPITAPSALRPDIPPLLNAIVLKAMERNLDERFATAADVADALNTFLVNKGHVRTERGMSEYMAGLFDADRRLGKLRVTQAVPVEHGGIQKTPSHLKLLAQHLSPIRSTPTLHGSQVKAVPVVSTTEPVPVEDPAEAHVVAPKSTTPRFIAIALTVAVIGVGLALFPKSEGPDQIDIKNEGVQITPHTETTISVVAPPKLPVEEKPSESDTGLPDERKPDNRSRVPKGKLTLDTSPWSEVFLKGKKLGDTPIVNYPLTPGIHVLTVVNEQKNLKNVIEVEIESGKTTVKKLKL